MVERADLAGTPYSSYEDVADDSPLGPALDVVHRVLTVEPFV